MIYESPEQASINIFWNFFSQFCIYISKGSFQTRCDIGIPGFGMPYQKKNCFNEKLLFWHILKLLLLLFFHIWPNKKKFDSVLEKMLSKKKPVRVQMSRIKAGISAGPQTQKLDLFWIKIDHFSGFSYRISHLRLSSKLNIDALLSNSPQ